jgi:hypothetical protein
MRFSKYRTAFAKEKELTDRALKLAEVVKPKSNWELQGILGLVAFVIGFPDGKWRKSASEARISLVFD